MNNTTTSQSAPTPVVGVKYKHKGFVFVVDRVSEVDVYVSRANADTFEAWQEWYGIMVTREVWDREMVGAVEVTS